MPRKKEVRVNFKADADDFARGVTAAEKDLDKFERKVKGSSGRMQSAFRGAGLKLGAAIGGALGLGAVAKQIVDVNVEFERLEAQLIAVTGSEEKAAVAFAEIEKFARETPYQLSEVVTGFTKLTALGLEPSMEALRSYGNTASAMGKDLDQFVEAIADASTGEFERLKEFGIKARSQGDQVSFTFQNVTKTVQKSAREIEGYLRDIGNVEFAGAMERQMDTLGGAFSNLEDAVDRLGREIGESGLTDWLTDMTNGLTDLINTATDAPRSIREIASELDRLENTYAPKRSRGARNLRIRETRADLQEALEGEGGSAGIRATIQRLDDDLVLLQETQEKLDEEIENFEGSRKETRGSGRSKGRSKYGRLVDELDETNKEIESAISERATLLEKLAELEFSADDEPPEESTPAGKKKKTSRAAAPKSDLRDYGDALYPLSKAEESAAAIAEIQLEMNQLRLESELLIPKMAELDRMFFEGEISETLYEQKMQDLIPLTEELGETSEETAEGLGSLAVAVGQTLANATGDAADAILDFSIRSESDVADMAQGIAESVAKMIIQFTLMKALFGGQTIGAEGNSGGLLSGLFASEKGNLFEGGKPVAFASGGTLIDRPTIFPMANGGTGIAGEAGVEAIFPLKRKNGVLGITGTGGGGAEVNIYATEPARVERSAGSGGDLREIIDVFIGDAAKSVDSGGVLGQSLERNYNLRRAGNIR